MNKQQLQTQAAVLESKLVGLEMAHELEPGSSAAALHARLTTELASVRSVLWENFLVLC